MKIKSVVFYQTAEPTGNREAIATMEDNSLRFVFSWFTDELTFEEKELVGLTIEEARDLKQKRDIEYHRTYGHADY